MIDEYWFDKVEAPVSYDLCINLKEGLNQLAWQGRSCSFICSTVVNWSFFNVFFFKLCWCTSIVNYRRINPAVVNYRWGQKDHFHVSLWSFICRKSNCLRLNFFFVRPITFGGPYVSCRKIKFFVGDVVFLSWTCMQKIMKKFNL